MLHQSFTLPRTRTRSGDAGARTRLAEAAARLLMSDPVRAIRFICGAATVDASGFRRVAALIAGGCIELRIDPDTDGAAYDAENGIIAIAHASVLDRSRGKGALIRAAAEAAICLAGPEAAAMRTTAGRLAEACFHMEADTALFADIAA